MPKDYLPLSSFLRPYILLPRFSLAFYLLSFICPFRFPSSFRSSILLLPSVFFIPSFLQSVFLCASICLPPSTQGLPSFLRPYILFPSSFVRLSYFLRSFILFPPFLYPLASILLSSFLGSSIVHPSILLPSILFPPSFYPPPIYPLSSVLKFDLHALYPSPSVLLTSFPVLP